MGLFSKKPKLDYEFRWYPVEDFEWRETRPDGVEMVRGAYFTGMGYNCSLNPAHDALRAKCAEWAAAGKINIAQLPKGAKFTLTRIGK